MPGSSRSCISASVPATTSPARAISSISWALLRMITAAAPVHLLERLLDLDPHLVGATVGVERDELARHAVVLDDRLGLRVVDRRAGARSPRACRRCVAPRRRARACGRWRRRRTGRRRESRRARGRARAAARRARRSAPRCAGSRRARSRGPRRSSSRSRIRPTVSSSGTSSPAARIGSTAGRYRSPPRSRRGTSRLSRGERFRIHSRLASPAFPCPRRAGRGRSRFTSGSPRRSASSSATASAASCRARRRPRSAPRCRRARARSPARTRRSG